MTQPLSSQSEPANPAFWELYQQGRYAEALVAAEQGLDYAREQLGEDHPGLGILLNELSAAHYQLGNYAQAEQALLQSINLLRAASGEFRRHHAGSLSNLAIVYQTIGDYTRAEPLCRQAVEIMRTDAGKENPDYATALNTLASLLYRMGEYAQAEPLWQETLQLRRAALGEDDTKYATILNNLAELYRAMGDLQRAEPLYRKALTIDRRAHGDRHPKVLAALNSLAEIHLSRGDTISAEPLVRESVLLSWLALGKEHPDHAVSLHNQAAFHLLQGDYPKALSLFQQAMEIERRAYGHGHPDIAIRLSMLALCHYRMGELAKAETLLRQALEITRTAVGEAHPTCALRLDNLAQLCAATGRPAEALTLLRQVAAIDDRVLGQIFAITSESQRLTYLAQLQWNTAEFLSLILQHFADSREAIGLAFDLVLRRKGVTAEAQTLLRDAVLGGRYPQLKPRLEELSALRMQIAEATLAGAEPEGVAVHRKRLAEWEEARQRLEAELARSIPEMNPEQKLRAADRRAVALTLPEGVALVEYVRFEVFDFTAPPASGGLQWQPARYLAFVLAGGHPDDVQMIDLGEVRPMDLLVELFRAGISQPPGERLNHNMVCRRLAEAELPGGDPGQLLRAAVFDPLRPALSGAERLLLSADGNLSRLPFGVLPEDDGRLLMDHYQVSYVNTGRDVLRFGAAASGSPTAPLLVADPDFDLASAETSARTDTAVPGRRSRDLPRDQMHFDRLPGTRTEGERLAPLLGVRPWYNEAAVEGRLKKECRSPRILHLATHGFFLEDQPHDPNVFGRDLGLLSGAMGRLSGPLPENPLLRSGLALAGANTWLKGGTPPAEAEDGLLTAEDVSGLNLLATELVVLSACETGLGEVKTGEGVFGLQRAFTLAGTKTLIMSLWSVPDDATRELMEDFYKRLLAGEGRADALRNAQLALRQKYPDPYYWGAFICQGDPAPLAPLKNEPR